MTDKQCLDIIEKSLRESFPDIPLKRTDREISLDAGDSVIRFNVEANNNGKPRIDWTPIAVSFLVVCVILGIYLIWRQ